MRLRYAVAAVLVSSMLVAGCSGDDDAEDVSTSTAAPGRQSSSTAAENTGTEPATTATSTPTTSSTAPSTTEATTTSTLSVDEQVRAAMLNYYEFYWRCLRAPADCDPAEVAVPDSDAFRALTTGRDDLIEGGYFVGPEDEGYMVITAIEPAGDHTLVTTCWWTTSWLYFQPPDPNLPPTVQNNTPGTSVEVYQFVQMPDLSWKIRRGDQVGEQVANENRCPPES